MFLFVSIAMIVLLIIAFIATVSLGRSQQPSQNKQYDQKRIQTLIMLSLIYLISVIGGGILLYYYFLK